MSHTHQCIIPPYDPNKPESRMHDCLRLGAPHKFNLPRRSHHIKTHTHTYARTMHHPNCNTPLTFRILLHLCVILAELIFSPRISVETPSRSTNGTKRPQTHGWCSSIHCRTHLPTHSRVHALVCMYVRTHARTHLHMLVHIPATAD